VTSLPGFNGALPELHSGYVTVDEAAGRAIFYVLVSATGVDPTTAPLVFWYQGGPGCSGLGGMLTENGPLVPNMQGGLSVNPISWTSIANIVYLEQPAFVGWSYSNTSSDRNTGDAQATADNVKFINGFLDLYPDFAGRDTWFTGESYGGTRETVARFVFFFIIFFVSGFYVPSLTAALLSDSSTQIYKQLQGFMVG
jgi:serine carboxypeptidase-like clade 2